MIPGLVNAGQRVLAPDMIGFGKSDKPTKKIDYTVARHVEWMRSWLLQLDLRNITFFGQDWGSLIGLTVCALEEDRVDRIMMANGGLPDPRHLERMAQARDSGSGDPESFNRWEKPFLTAYGKADPVLGWWDKIFQEYIPGAKGQPHTEFSDGIHFIQEQCGPELSRIMNDFIAANPLP